MLREFPLLSLSGNKERYELSLVVMFQIRSNIVQVVQGRYRAFSERSKFA
jgi:hypothetical protein